MIVTITTEAKSESELTDNLTQIIKAINSGEDLPELMDGSYQIGASNVELDLIEA